MYENLKLHVIILTKLLIKTLQNITKTKILKKERQRKLEKEEEVLPKLYFFAILMDGLNKYTLHEKIEQEKNCNYSHK